MTGIQFIVDKTGVLIDLKKHEALWEDFYDIIFARTRTDEPRESLDEVKSILCQKGKIRA
ncbi:MAG: hypothetical protein QME58_12175 [Bacteroidota bacterium]|nr:hypothetical protein [Bacteroidota bacterium]